MVRPEREWFLKIGVCHSRKALRILYVALACFSLLYNFQLGEITLIHTVILINNPVFDCSATTFDGIYDIAF